MFTKQDINQIQAKGLTLKAIHKQLEAFKQGMIATTLVAAATDGNGIVKLTNEQLEKYTAVFNKKAKHLTTEKFIPASGAATRMFKFLFEFAEKYNPNQETINSYINRNNATDLAVFFVGVEKLPFYKEVITEVIKYYPNFKTSSSDTQKLLFVKTMLDTDKLNFGNFPKGLLPFHKYKNHTTTAFEEHLYEAALLAKPQKEARLHFTINKNHEKAFKALYKKVKPVIEKETGVEFHVAFSYQNEATDTLAITPKGEPFRDLTNSLLFRPAGHGALIENLNALNADVVFIKNIDNVAVNSHLQFIVTYKKALAGLLVTLQEKAFNYLEELTKPQLEDKKLVEIEKFLINKLNVKFSNHFKKYTKEFKIETLKNKLYRPLRVCGMVKNEGDPGGGPFWVKNEEGEISLQIVETAQIDLNNKTQENILKEATYFNPVDIVCGLKDFKGNAYKLLEYVDYNSGFITRKTKFGKSLKALELPGLWNGSMAYWNTVFVEVPLITFNPVKTVNNLLKDSHQVY